MDIKKLLGLSLALLILVPITGCIDQSPSPDEETIKITDMLGRKVKVPKDVKEVIGIGAGALRLLVYLECVNMVVGVEDIELSGGKPYNYAHPEISKIPSIGPMHGGDAEMITGKDPDVILWTYTTEGDADDLQQKTSIPIVVLDYGNLGDDRATFYEALRLVAKVTGKEKRAEDLIGYIDGLINDLDTRTKSIPEAEKSGIYVGGIGYRGVHGILSTEPAYEPLAFVNGKNVAAELGKDHAFVDKEKVLEWDPDIILVDLGGMFLISEDLKDEAYADVKAVKDGEIYGVMPYNYYTTNFGTVLADAYYIGTVLFPDEFSDVGPEVKADEIYKELLGKGVHGDLETLYGSYGKVTLDG